MTPHPPGPDRQVRHPAPPHHGHHPGVRRQDAHARPAVERGGNGLLRGGVRPGRRWARARWFVGRATTGRGTCVWIWVETSHVCGRLSQMAGVWKQSWGVWLRQGHSREVVTGNRRLSKCATGREAACQQQASVKLGVSKLSLCRVSSGAGGGGYGRCAVPDLLWSWLTWCQSGHTGRHVGSWMCPDCPKSASTITMSGTYASHGATQSMWTHLHDFGLVKGSQATQLPHACAHKCSAVRTHSHAHAHCPALQSASPAPTSQLCLAALPKRLPLPQSPVLQDAPGTHG